MNDATGTADHTPQLRTLLLTDLCDSTRLVEQLGDQRAAAFFRSHDHFVLELQQRWRGRLIDRSDGMLLLFERPLDGLGFALDYRRGLEALGREYAGQVVRARSGLHVGEVLIWHNSQDAVQAGAKPVEIEGLAKPLAARLMQLALPGQILLSPVVEPLLRRAAGELGERGRQLEWRDHGRWLLRGLPGAQTLYEVGEPGLAPLRRPRGDAKSRRDLPLWRRPAMLAAEVLLVVAIAGGGWVAMRPEPAIAFAERDWVVVAGMRNLTGQSLLDASLEQALRISLQQSRYVNVISEMKMAQTLADMRVDPAKVEVDRAVASEVAARDGAKAVLVPTLREVNGRLQFVVEVVDPGSQATVYTVQADAAGLDTALDMVDTVVGKLRAELGEALANIREDSLPLPQVATSDLSALRAYALAEQAMPERRFDEAANLYRTAVQIDPGFIRARLGLVSLHRAYADFDQARDELARVEQHLSPAASARERLMVDAWRAELAPDGDPLPHWQAIAQLYPGTFTGDHNASWYLLMENRYQEAMGHAQAASVPQAPRRASSLVHVARIHNALGRPQEALKVLEEVERLSKDGSGSTLAEALFLAGRTAEARGQLEKVSQETGLLPWTLARQGLVAFALAEGDPVQALELAAPMRGRSGDLPAPFPEHYRLYEQLVRVAAGQTVPAAELRQLFQALRRATGEADAYSQNEGLFRVGALAYVAQRSGQPELAKDMINWLLPHAERAHSRLLARLLLAVRAHQAGLEGRAEEGMRMLHGQLDGSEMVLARVVMRDLARAAGNVSAVREQEQWLQGHRGQAMSEVALAQLLQPLAVAEAWAADVPAARPVAAVVGSGRRE
jgi:putative peptide modification system cyclase